MQNQHNSSSSPTPTLTNGPSTNPDISSQPATNSQTHSPQSSSQEDSSTAVNSKFYYSPFQRSFAGSILMTEISCKDIPFIICDSPDNTRIDEYVKIFKAKGVTDIVRACKPKYDENAFICEGISVHEFYFEDGGIPSDSLLSEWLALVYECEAHNSAYVQQEAASLFSKKRTIAVHCVAGLGRAPLLVAIALVEFGMSPIDTIELVRSRRKGSLNSKQIRYLVDVYRPGKLYCPSAVSLIPPSSQSSARSSYIKNSPSDRYHPSYPVGHEQVSSERKGFLKSFFRMFS